MQPGLEVAVDALKGKIASKLAIPAAVVWAVYNIVIHQLEGWFATTALTHPAIAPDMLSWI